jgi:hypothetical protein
MLFSAAAYFLAVPRAAILACIFASTGDGVINEMALCNLVCHPVTMSPDRAFPTP